MTLDAVNVALNDVVEQTQRLRRPRRAQRSVALGTFAKAASVGEDRAGALALQRPDEPGLVSSEASASTAGHDGCCTIVFDVAGAALRDQHGVDHVDDPVRGHHVGVVTFARSTKTEPSTTLIVTERPSAVFAEVSLTTSAAWHGRARRGRAART